LGSRCIEIYSEFPTGFLDKRLWSATDPFDVVNSADNTHFRIYKLHGSVYRLCAFFGWIELYRREVAFLDAGHDGKNVRLEACIHAVQGALADGQLNEHADWNQWTDRLIFREEQRAIGEAMIRGTGTDRHVLGYGAFQAAIEDGDRTLSRFIQPAIIFMTDTKPRNLHLILPNQFRAP